MPRAAAGGDLLQQRRLPRHVRARHDRPGRHARAARSGIGAGPASARNAGRSRAHATAPGRHASSVRNVPSYRHLKDVEVEVEGHGAVRGDVAWGGNWFFLVSAHGRRLDLGDADALTDYTWRIRQALENAGVRGASGRSDRPRRAVRRASERRCRQPQFRAVPGQAYDRSPCGTGTSAKLACLHADGKLAARRRRGRRRASRGACSKARLKSTPGASYRRHGPGLDHRRQHAASRFRRSLLLGNSARPQCAGRFRHNA